MVFIYKMSDCVTREDLRVIYLEIERQKNISKVQEFVDKITAVIMGSNASGHTFCYVTRPFTPFLI